MSEHDRRHEYRAEVLLFAVVIIWGANYPLVKWCIGGLNVYVFNAIRFVVASVVVAGIFAARSPWHPVARRDMPKLIGVGFATHVLYQVAFIVGLSMTTAGNSAVLLATSPLWTAFFDAWIHKERMLMLTWIGMATSLVGIVLIIFGNGRSLEFSEDALLGDVVTLFAALVWGLNTNLQKPLLARYPVLQVTLVMMIVGGVGLSLVALPAMTALDWGSVQWMYYAAAVASGALSIGISSALWSNGVKRLGPGRTANLYNLVPVLAVILSAATLHEEITMMQVLGMGITMSGVWIARRTTSRYFFGQKSP